MIKPLRSFLNNAWGRCLTFIKERPNQFAREFISHNRKTWKDFRSDRSQGEILIEVNNIPSCTLAFSYLSQLLGAKYKAKIIAFGKGFSRTDKAVYGSFADELLVCLPKQYQVEIDTLFDEIFATISTKRDLENLHVENVLIGDLVYDSYIRKLDRVTVDLADSEFPLFLKDALAYYIYWKKYFLKHPVKAVVVSHCVFSWAGMIVRMAVQNRIPVYLARANRVYYISESHNSRAYNQYIDYPIFFSQLSKAEQTEALVQAHIKIDQRLRGERDVSAYHLLKPTYSHKSSKQVLKSSPRIKVLVASHCFSDDNHVYGTPLFPDFYEWLDFIGKIIERTEYDWYIKLHPDRYSWETEHIHELARRYPKFHILSSEVSHHQIVEDGIDCVLTVHGTIAFEYAALGIPVITASVWNPTIAYDFNIHSKTIGEYEATLLNLNHLNVDIDLDQIAEFYYCHYINDSDGWLYDSYSQFIVDVGGSPAYLGSQGYKVFINQFNLTKHKKVLATLDRFVLSKDYYMRPCNKQSLQ